MPGLECLLASQPACLLPACPEIQVVHYIALSISYYIPAPFPMRSETNMQKGCLRVRRSQTADGSDGGFQRATRRGAPLVPIQPGMPEHQVRVGCCCAGCGGGLAAQAVVLQKSCKWQRAPPS